MYPMVTVNYILFWQPLMFLAYMHCNGVNIPINSISISISFYNIIVAWNFNNLDPFIPLDSFI